MVYYSNALKKILCIMISGVCLVSCSRTDLPKDNSLITVGIGAMPTELDPQLAIDSSSIRVIDDLFEGLVSFDQSNETIPGLAKSWSVSSDDKVYTFHLRDGLKFSDGSPITADDIVFSWRRLVDPKTNSDYRYALNDVVNAPQIIAGKLSPEMLGIKALDEHTLEVSLISSNNAFLSICAQPALDVLSRANVTTYGNKWTLAVNMVTSGAYKLKAIEPGRDVVELGKNLNYYDAKFTAIDNVKMLALANSSDTIKLYDENKLDVSWNISIIQLATVKNRTDLYSTVREGIYYYDFNMNNPEIRAIVNT